MAGVRTERRDVVVVGGGNAGFCAAHAAREAGADVLLLERTTATEAGGNSYYTAGAFRVVHSGVVQLAEFLDDSITRQRLSRTRLEPYTVEQFRADLERLTNGRTDPVMADLLVARSGELVPWLAGKGIRWRLMYDRQAYLSADEEWVFSGGVALGTVDGGRGLMAAHLAAARASGVEVRYGSRVTDLLGDRSVTGVRYADPEGVEHEVHARAVVLTAGGFEANPELRGTYLGEVWTNALVRGNPHNTGDVLELAIARGAARHGDWSSCHSVAWDAGAPSQGGDRRLTNQRTRQGYPLGIVVNREGRRFVDEGADFRNHTYAKYGREILRQPGGVAFQLFDATTRPLLRPEEYESEPITMATSDSLEGLAARLGIDSDGLVETVREFNTSIVDKPFDPAVLDGRGAEVTPLKSNWAVALERPPFYGYAVSCGITFTFGGLHVDGDGRVLARDGGAVDGLFAAGEIVGGLFSDNYPGGSGLTAGGVWGRLAGRAAASLP